MKTTSNTLSTKCNVQLSRSTVYRTPSWTWKPSSMSRDHRQWCINIWQWMPNGLRELVQLELSCSPNITHIFWSGAKNFKKGIYNITNLQACIVGRSVPKISNIYRSTSTIISMVCTRVFSHSWHPATIFPRPRLEVSLSLCWSFPSCFGDQQKLKNNNIKLCSKFCCP
jgi:hypothetical protein